MPTEILTPEVVPAEADPNNKLVRCANETGLDRPASQTLIAAFAPVFERARAALESARGVAESVKDATCVTEIRKSRECRLAIRAVRIEGEKIHRAQKEASLRYGKAVDGFKNILLADLGPVEDALEAAEKTAERAEAARKAALKAARETELQPLLDYPVAAMNLGEMTDAAFAWLLTTTKAARQAKLDAAAKAEAERIAKAAAAKAERERIEAENARLKAEADAAAAEARRVAVEAEKERKRMEAEREAERRKAEAEAKKAAEVARKEREALEAKARAEREQAEVEAKRLAGEAAKERRRLADARDAAEAKLRAEIAEKERAEAEAKAKAAAEEKARKEAERKAAAAPDKKKLALIEHELRRYVFPDFSGPMILARLQDSFAECADAVAQLAEEL